MRLVNFTVSSGRGMEMYNPDKALYKWLGLALEKAEESGSNYYEGNFDTSYILPFNKFGFTITYDEYSFLLKKDDIKSYMRALENYSTFEICFNRISGFMSLERAFRQLKEYLLSAWVRVKTEYDTEYPNRAFCFATDHTMLYELVDNQIQRTISNLFSSSGDSPAHSDLAEFFDLLYNKYLENREIAETAYRGNTLTESFYRYSSKALRYLTLLIKFADLIIDVSNTMITLKMPTPAETYTMNLQELEDIYDINENRVKIQSERIFHTSFYRPINTSGSNSEWEIVNGIRRALGDLYHYDSPLNEITDGMIDLSNQTFESDDDEVVKAPEKTYTVSKKDALKRIESVLLSHEYKLPSRFLDELKEIVKDSPYEDLEMRDLFYQDSLYEYFMQEMILTNSQLD